MKLQGRDMVLSIYLSFKQKMEEAFFFFLFAVANLQSRHHCLCLAGDRTEE